MANNVTCVNSNQIVGALIHSNQITSIEREKTMVITQTFFDEMRETIRALREEVAALRCKQEQSDKSLEAFKVEHKTEAEINAKNHKTIGDGLGALTNRVATLEPPIRR